MPQGGHTLLSPPSGISAWRPRNARLPTGHTGVTTRGPRFTQRSIMQTRRPRRGRADQHAYASACVLSASARIPGRAVSQRRYDISVESRKRAAARAHQRTNCSILTAEPASSSFRRWRSRALRCACDVLSAQRQKFSAWTSHGAAKERTVAPCTLGGHRCAGELRSRKQFLEQRRCGPEHGEVEVEE